MNSQKSFDWQDIIQNQEWSIMEHRGSYSVFSFLLLWLVFLFSFVSPSPLLAPSFIPHSTPSSSLLSFSPPPPSPPFLCVCSLTWQTWTGVSWVRKSVWSIVVHWWGPPVSMSPTWPSCPSSSSLVPTPWLFLSRSSSSADTSRQR